MSLVLPAQGTLTATPTMVWGSFKRILISLEENSSTGYRWSVQKPDDVAVDALSFTQDQPDTVGTGGVRQFAIESSHPCIVVFEMRRPWESADIAPVRKVTVTVE